MGRGNKDDFSVKREVEKKARSTYVKARTQHERSERNYARDWEDRHSTLFKKFWDKITKGDGHQ